MRLYGQTDKGLVRSNNQDAYYLCQINETTAFAVVCDGMGGAAAGNVASQLATKVIADYIKKSFSTKLTPYAMETMLRSAVASANVTVYETALSNEVYKGMGTTVVLAFVNGRQAYILHAGDSRAYLFDGSLRAVTVDHSVVQTLLDNGKITEDEARNHPQRHMITRALGIAADVTPEFNTVDLTDNTVLLLCSDGLYNYTDPLITEQRLSALDEQTALHLVNDALQGGGGDNVTAVIISMK